MGPIRSPLGALGAILVGMEGVAGATLFALGSDPHLRSVMVYTIIGGFIIITLATLALVAFFAKTNPGFLFNPADVGKLSEAAQQRFFRISEDMDLEVRAIPTPYQVSRGDVTLNVPASQRIDDTDA